MGRRLFCKQEAAGSIPVCSIWHMALAVCGWRVKVLPVALGAAAASVAAECFITSLYLWLGRDFIKLKMLVRYGWRRLVAAVIMLGAVVWTGQFLEQVRGLGPITTFIQIGAGAMVYFLVLLVMRDPFLYQYLGKIYRRLTGQP